MGLLDNDTVIVDAILTKIGRQKLANGQPLGITQYAFGDTGVDYTLYNAAHPSGSDSYGKAITDLPMLEAVPDDNVFLRYKLYGEGERNVQNFSRIKVTSGTSVTIEKQAGLTSSETITLTPEVQPNIDGALFEYKILDVRGLKFPNATIVPKNYEGVGLPQFSHPDPVVGIVSDIGNLQVSAEDAQITSQRSIGIEVSRDGSAPAFITVTINVNNTKA